MKKKSGTSDSAVGVMNFIAGGGGGGREVRVWSDDELNDFRRSENVTGHVRVNPV